MINSLSPTLLRMHPKLLELESFATVQAPSRILYSRALEYVLLSWNLAFLLDTTCTVGAESKPTSRAWGWQGTVVARDSGRTPP